MEKEILLGRAADVSLDEGIIVGDKEE